MAFGSNTTGNENCAVGYEACENNTTAGNTTAFGFRALESNTTGSSNVAIGHHALSSCTTGGSNTAVGRSAARANVSGSENTIIGKDAGNALTAGQNVMVGNWAGSYVTALTSGTQNIFLGAYCRGSSATATLQHCIGYNFGALSGNNTFSVQASSGSYQSNNSSSWSTTSDKRIKKNINNNSLGLDVIEKIQVRNFEYKKPNEIITDNPELEKVIDSISNKPEGQQIGVIAQEIEEILPDVVKTQTTGVKTVNPDNLTWYLINAVKELSAKLKALEGK